MSGLLGMGSSRNTTPNKLGSIRLQTSEYGVVVPVVLGTNRIQIKLADYVDFEALGVTSSGGGKGGGSAKSYDYIAAVLMLLCEGPIDGIGNIYDQTGSLNLINVTEVYTVPSGGGSYTVQNSGIGYYYDQGCTYASTYSISANDYGSGGASTLTGTQQTPMEKGSYPGANIYSVSNTGVYSFSSADFGKVVSVTYAYQPNATADTTNPTTGLPDPTTGTQNPAQVLQLTTILGTDGQSPWGYMESAHPERALSYSGRAFIASQSLDLGSSAQIPSLQVEVLNGGGLLQPGFSDNNVADVIQYILTKPRVGAGWNHLSDLSLYRNFSTASGIRISPVYDSATSLSSVLNEILQLSVSSAVYSQGQLKIIPRADTTIIGSGAIYSPPTQPLYDLDTSDFIRKSKKKEALTSEWTALTDNYNHYFLEYYDRSMSYNNNVIEDFDDASISTYGLRDGGTLSFHHITSDHVAQTCLSMILHDSSFAKKNWYFSLPSYYALLDGMDVVTLTDPSKNLLRYPVRIQKISEDSVGNLEVTAQDFAYSSVQPAVYGKQGNSGTQLTGSNSPGQVAHPIIFEAVGRISSSGDNELWIGLTGASPDWGGCDIWISTDNVNYLKIGRQSGRARMGFLTTGIGAGLDPDPYNSLHVNFSESFAEILPGTQQDADTYKTLLYVDGELMCYTTATLEAAYTYRFDSYIRRGVFFTGISVLGGLVQGHDIDTSVLRIDSQVFKYVYDISLIGKTVYLKFPSFNNHEQMLESLADCTTYTHSLTGAYSTTVPSSVTDMVIVPYNDSTTGNAGLNIYIGGGSPGDAGHFFTPSGATLVAPPYQFSNLEFVTSYLVNYFPSNGNYRLYTDGLVANSDVLQFGAIPVGYSQTLSSTGTGGSPSPGGGGTPYPGEPTCFIRGTDYLTDKGNLPNTTIMEMWIKDPNSIALIGRTMPEPIKWARWAPVDTVYLIEVKGKRRFECSATAPFSVGCNKFVQAKDLKRGMMIETTGGFLPVDQIVSIKRNDYVLHLELEGPSHEYIVVGSVWSHNIKYSSE